MVLKVGWVTQEEQGELATKCGYWPLYTFDPRLEEQGKNPLTLTGKEPDWDLYEQFLMNEVRYNSLKKANPEHAAELFERNKKTLNVAIDSLSVSLWLIIAMRSKADKIYF